MIIGICQEEEDKLTDLQRKRLQAESLVSHFENNNVGYEKIRSVVEQKVYSTLSNAALLLKFAVSSVFHSIRNSPEQYISLIQDNFSSARYNTPSHQFYTDDYPTQHFETILVNDAAKMYNNLARNLIDEILSSYDFRSSSQSSLPLCLVPNYSHAIVRKTTKKANSNDRDTADKDASCRSVTSDRATVPVQSLNRTINSAKTMRALSPSSFLSFRSQNCCISLIVNNENIVISDPKTGCNFTIVSAKAHPRNFIQ